MRTNSYARNNKEIVGAVLSVGSVPRLYHEEGRAGRAVGLDHLPKMFSIVDPVRMTEALDPVKKLTD
jgi:hypothetical protein